MGYDCRKSAQCFQRSCGACQLGGISSQRIPYDVWEFGQVERESKQRDFYLKIVIRTVKFWDLENFNLVSSTEPDARSVACVKFHPEGTPLFGGGEDSLKVPEFK